MSDVQLAEFQSASSPRMSRAMVYPYTFGAMLRAFPLKFHLEKSWVYKSYALGLLVSTPLFFKITTAFPAEANLWAPFEAVKEEKH